MALAACNIAWAASFNKRYTTSVTAATAEATTAKPNYKVVGDFCATVDGNYATKFTSYVKTSNSQIFQKVVNPSMASQKTHECSTNGKPSTATLTLKNTASVGKQIHTTGSFNNAA